MKLYLRKVTIDPFDAKVVVNRFDCGRAGLDRYLKNRAKKTNARNEHRVFIVREKGSEQCIGFYSLSIGTDLVSDIMKGLQEYVAEREYFSSIHLEYLAVDRHFQGEGLGRFMLMDAFRRVTIIARNAGFYAFTLQSLDRNSTAFYERIGFQTYLHGDHPKMFYPLNSLLQLSNAG